MNNRDALDRRIHFGLYGSEDILRARVDTLKKQLKDKDFKQWLEGQKISVADAKAIIELAEKYRGGWRP